MSTEPAPPIPPVLDVSQIGWGVLVQTVEATPALACPYCRAALYAGPCALHRPPNDPAQTEAPDA